ncbi:MAG: 50S ribosomal protein L18, partial [Patescibacteria group bacterium]
SSQGLKAGKESGLTGKTGLAYETGLVLAKEAVKKGVEKVCFDRGGYKYHGRVKAVADGARAGGLKF